MHYGTKKTKLVMAIIFGLLILSAVITILLKAEWIFFSSAILIIIVEMLLSRYENQKMIKTVSPLLANKQTDLAIEYLLSKENSYLFPVNNKANKLSLILLYAQKGDLIKAKELIEKGKFDNNKRVFYLLFVISLSENNLVKAKYYAERLYEVKDKLHFSQQQNARKVLKMIETGIVDEDVLKNTQYSFLKELCLKYKNGETVIFNENLNSIPDLKVVKQPVKKNKKITVLGIVLVVLSIVVSYFLLMMVAFKASKLTQTEGLFEMQILLRNAWYLMFIPLASIIFGIVFRKKGYRTLINIIVGAITLFFLFIEGVVGLSSPVIKMYDSKVLEDVVMLENTNMPDNVIIYYENYSENNDNYTILVRFEKKEEFDNFRYSLNDNWLKGEVVVETIDTILYDFEYYSIYSLDTNSYYSKIINYDYCYLIAQIDVENMIMIIEKVTFENDY